MHDNIALAVFNHRHHHEKKKKKSRQRLAASVSRLASIAHLALNACEDSRFSSLILIRIKLSGKMTLSF